MVSCSKIAAFGQEGSPDSTFCPKTAIIHKGLRSKAEDPLLTQVGSGQGIS
jgi:hypothetical protein